MIVEDLTIREIEAFYLFMEGLSTKEVSEKMGIAIKTVETYRIHIIVKSNCKTLMEVIIKYYEYQLAKRKKKPLRNFRVYLFQPNNKKRRRLR